MPQGFPQDVYEKLFWLGEPNLGVIPYIWPNTFNAYAKIYIFLIYNHLSKVHRAIIIVHSHHFDIFHIEMI